MFWSENVLNIQDVFVLIPAPEIRSLRDEAPANLATLCNKAVEKMIKAVDNSCRTQQEQQTGNLYCTRISIIFTDEILIFHCLLVLNCCRLLTRLLPYIFEDPDWHSYLLSNVRSRSSDDGQNTAPLAHLLLGAISVIIKFTLLQKSQYDNSRFTLMFICFFFCRIYCSVRISRLQQIKKPDR